MARFFLPCARALAVRCLGQHGGWWRTPKHEHAEPRRSVGWAHDMENFRCDGAADRGGNGGFDLRTHKRLRSARVCTSNFKNLFLSCKTTRTTIFLPIWAVFRRGFDKTPLRAAQGAQVPNGTKGAQYRVCLERAVEHITSTLDCRLKLQRSAWGAGNSARRKYSPRARSFRILDALDSAHARRERPDQAIFRRSLV